MTCVSRFASHHFSSGSHGSSSVAEARCDLPTAFKSALSTHGAWEELRRSLARLAWLGGLAMAGGKVRFGLLPFARCEKEGRFYWGVSFFTGSP